MSAGLALTGLAGSRIALGCAAMGVVAAGSYVAQRLLSPGDPVAAAIVAQEHIPFYWRAALAALHGVMAGSIVGLGARDPDRALALVPLIVGIAGPALILAALVVP